MLTFYFCDKIPEMNNFKEGKIYFYSVSDVLGPDCSTLLPLGLWQGSKSRQRVCGQENHSLQGSREVKRRGKGASTSSSKACPNA
jgi:hypothetical protein